MIAYNRNSNSDSDNNLEFVDIDLPCNKQSVRLLANDLITRTKKKRVLETKNEADEPSKVKTTLEKITPVKRIGKQSSKASVLISGLVGKSPPDNQVLLMNTNIVVPALHLFQISPKFREGTRRLMTALQKRCKRRVVPFSVPIIEEEKELYVKMHHPNKDIVNTNHILLQILNQELAENL